MGVPINSKFSRTTNFGIDGGWVSRIFTNGAQALNVAADTNQTKQGHRDVDNPHTYNPRLHFVFGATISGTYKCPRDLT